MRKIFSLCIAVSVFTPVAMAQDWPQWRGPARDGSVPAAAVPAAWPAAFAAAWTVEVGEGYSSPVVRAGRVFVHSRRDPNELVTAIDAASGKTAWQQSYDAAFAKNNYAAKMAKGPHATPLVDGGRVFTIGATGVLNAWDSASGRRLWMKDFSKSVDTSKLFCGTAASPLLVGGRLVVQVGSDIHGGEIVALDPTTGTPAWTWKGPGPGYASPVVVTIGAATQIVTMTNQSIVGIDARNGAALWSVPFPDDWHENIVTPVWTGAELIVSGTRQGTQAFRLSETGGKWQATSIWKNPDVAMYMSTPVYADGIVYGLSSRRRGQYVAVDAKTGTLKWATEGREADHASVLLAPRHVLFLTNAGALVVARRDATAFTLDKKYTLSESETWAVPVLLGRDLLIRDASRVVKLTAK
jgi:outer membrane protein assembly factor BamB